MNHYMESPNLPKPVFYQTGAFSEYSHVFCTSASIP